MTTMLTITRLMRPDRTRLVVDGRVSCPHGHADVDVDWCFTCPSFEGTVDRKSGGTWVKCRVPGS